MTSTTARGMDSDELRSVRARLEASQADMADRLYISLRQYKRYEAGGAPISRRRAEQIRDLLPARKRGR